MRPQDADWEQSDMSMHYWNLTVIIQSEEKFDIIKYGEKLHVQNRILGKTSIICACKWIAFLGMEFTGPSKRRFAGQLCGFFWTSGNLILAGLGYAIRDWTKLQLACAAPGVIFMLYWM